MTASRTLVALLIATGLIGSLISGAAFYTHLLVVGIILLVGNWIWVTVLLRTVRLERRPDFSRGTMGDIFKEQYEVENASRLPAEWVEVYNDMPLPTAAGSRLVTRLRPFEKQTYVARTWLTRRGGFPVGPTIVRVSDPLGLFRRQRVFPAQQSLVVLPMIFHIDSFLGPPGLVPGGAAVRGKASDITPHAAGVRDYVPGDPMKRIHWPSSVRRGLLMVKEFDQDPQAEIWLFLDAQRSVQAQMQYEMPEMPIEKLLFTRKPKLALTPATLEYGVSIGASLTHYFLREGRAVGLATEDAGYYVLAAERSQRQESKILETLAFVQGKGDLSIAALAAAQARQLAQGSTVVLITPSVSPDIAVAADDLQRRNLRPVVILLVAKSFGGPEGSDKIGQQLMAQNVPVCYIYCDTNLTEALSSFSASHTQQDVNSWRRPTLSHLI